MGLIDANKSIRIINVKMKVKKKKLKGKSTDFFPTR